MTGIGTIDRMKRRARHVYLTPIEWSAVFGTDMWLLWPLPIDPTFEDEDQVLGYGNSACCSLAPWPCLLYNLVAIKNSACGHHPSFSVCRFCRPAHPDRTPKVVPEPETEPGQEDMKDGGVPEDEDHLAPL